MLQAAIMEEIIGWPALHYMHLAYEDFFAACPFASQTAFGKISSKLKRGRFIHNSYDQNFKKTVNDITYFNNYMTFPVLIDLHLHSAKFIQFLHCFCYCRI